MSGLKPNQTPRKARSRNRPTTKNKPTTQNNNKQSPGVQKQPNASRSKQFKSGDITQVFERPLNQRYHAENFLQIITKHQDKNQIVCLFDEHIERLKELLNADYSINATNKTFSFKNCFILIVKCIVDCENTIHLKEYQKIIETIYFHGSFWDKLTLCLVHCSPEMNCSPKGLPSFGFPDYLLQTLKLIKIFISKINSAKCEDKIKNLLMPISLCKMKISQSDIHFEEITQLEGQIIKIINTVVVKEKPVVKKQKVRKTFGFSILPGEYRDDEPRHDNDNSDIKEIKIIPTMDELECELEPYLPTEMNSSNWYENETDSYFDYQFRLLREDTLRSFRRAIQYFLIQKVGNNQISMQCKDEKQKKFATIRIYHDASIYNTSISKKTGELNFHILFDESRILNNHGNTKQQKKKRKR